MSNSVNMIWISKRKYQTYQTWPFLAVWWWDGDLQMLAPHANFNRLTVSNPPGKFQRLHGFFLQQPGAMLRKATVVKHSHKEVGIRHGTHQTTLQMSHDTTSRPKRGDWEQACANHRKHQKSSLYIVWSLFLIICCATFPWYLNKSCKPQFAARD